MPKLQFNTRDIGLAIRDHLEQHNVTHYAERGAELTAAGADEVVFVDVSDAHNPIVGLNNGQTFAVRVFAGEPPKRKAKPSAVPTGVSLAQFIEDSWGEAFDSDGEIEMNGGDVVEWFGDLMPMVRAILKQVQS